MFEIPKSMPQALPFSGNGSVDSVHKHRLQGNHYNKVLHVPLQRATYITNWKVVAMKMWKLQIDFAIVVANYTILICKM